MKLRILSTKLATIISSIVLRIQKKFNLTEEELIDFFLSIGIGCIIFILLSLTFISPILFELYFGGN